MFDKMQLEKYLKRKKLELLQETLELCDLIEENSDFFAAPFLQKQNFANYLTFSLPNSNNTIGDFFKLYNHSFNEFLCKQADERGKSLNEIRSEYYRAITGGGAIGKGIINGEKLTLKNFFDNNSEIKKFFIQNHKPILNFTEMWIQFNQMKKDNNDKKSLGKHASTEITHPQLRSSK